MQKMSYVFSRLIGGHIKTVADLVEARRVQLHEADADVQAYERFVGHFEDGLREGAPKSLVQPSLLTAESSLRQHARADWQHVHPGLMIWAARFIEAARRRGIPLFVHSAFRTRAEQEDLFRRKVTRAPWPRAPHCLGEAVDIVHLGHAWDLSRDEWAFLGKLGKDAHERLMSKTPKGQRWDLKWGGDWPTFYDPAHWEVGGWSNRVRHLEPGVPRRLTPRGILALP